MCLGSLLDELQVRCPAKCGWVGRQDAREAHTASCPQRLLHTRQHLTRSKEDIEAKSVEVQRLRGLVEQREADLAFNEFHFELAMLHLIIVAQDLLSMSRLTISFPYCLATIPLQFRLLPSFAHDCFVTLPTSA